LEHSLPTLDEVMRLAEDELVVLRKPDGTVFALSQVEDLDVEVALLKRNPEFATLMRRLSVQKGAISIEDLRRELAI
jgi:hypothetical protein